MDDSKKEAAVLNKKSLVGIIIIMCVGLITIVAFGQDDIDPEKKRLIDELLELTDAQNNTINVIDAIFAQFKEDYKRMAAQYDYLDRDDTVVNRVESVERRMYIERELQNLRRVRKIFTERLDYNELVKELYCPLYDKYFTTEELRDIVAFYKTPTGKKTILVMPQLFRESMARSNEVLTPKITQLMQELMDEEAESLEQRRVGDEN